MLSLKLRKKSLGPSFYNVCWMTSDMWMRMDGSLSQTDRRQETINVHVNYLFIFKKYHDLLLEYELLMYICVFFMVGISRDL